MGNYTVDYLFRLHSELYDGKVIHKSPANHQFAPRLVKTAYLIQGMWAIAHLQCREANYSKYRNPSA